MTVLVSDGRRVTYPAAQAKLPSRIELALNAGLDVYFYNNLLMKTEFHQEKDPHKTCLLLGCWKIVKIFL